MVKKLNPFYSDIEMPRDEAYDGQKRTLILFLLVMVFSLAGLIRIFDLMVVSGAKNREIADNNRIKLNVITAARGVIYDRNKEPLARNTGIYQKPIESNNSNGKYQAITKEEALKIEEKGQREALGIKIKSIREYLYGDTFAHVLGYMTEINEEELRNKYNLGDKKGRLGLEETYEDSLRGIDGKELVEVDATGKTSKKLGEQIPIPGKDLETTLDLKLQKLIAENFPKNQKGAVVASDPSTGEILALYSSPTFDPGLFNGGYEGDGGNGGKQEKLIQVLNDRDSPLFNRAISGTYPSGSIFKIVTAASALESGKINKDTEIEDVGEITIGPFRFPNWYFLQYGKKEGMVNIIRAIKRSNDIFFYKVGELVGIDNLVAMANGI
ncbi:hypothetical protein HY030_01185 [Candidatus Gottesmanbacteria bacterium]|nr:hypothetical protein [Candidatus Gottesmanbacteria bacterium]